MIEPFKARKSHEGPEVAYAAMMGGAFFYNSDTARWICYDPSLPGDKDKAFEIAGWQWKVNAARHFLRRRGFEFNGDGVVACSPTAQS